MNKRLISVVIKVIILSVFLAATSIAFSTLYPIITNELAMGQLTNDAFGYITWDTWVQFVKIFKLIKVAIAGIISVSIAVDIVTYFKTRKEN